MRRQAYNKCQKGKGTKKTFCLKRNGLSNFGFPKKARLLKKSGFETLLQEGKKIYTDSFLAFVLKGASDNNRIGITISKKVGNAVKRNRIKRIIREYFRHNKQKISGPVDVNIIARKGLTRSSNRQINEKLEKLFLKITKLEL